MVFRDGVGDGQLRTVAGYEVQQLSECFSLFGESYEPKLAVVIVSKRINARIFASQVSWDAMFSNFCFCGPTPKM